MTRAELTALHEKTCAKARTIQVAKNHDYAHEGDIFRNFRRYGTFGVLVRLSDKLARLDSFEENKEFAVAAEKLEDTIIDIINYATIYLAMKQEDKPTIPERMKGNNLITPEAREVLLRAPRVEVKDGPYCECSALPAFRVDNGKSFAPYYFCAACAEKQPQWLVNLMTAMDKL